MNYNMPFNPFNSMAPNFDPILKIQMLEQEIMKLRNIVNNLDQRVSNLEEKSLKKETPNYLNSNVVKEGSGLYML